MDAVEFRVRMGVDAFGQEHESPNYDIILAGRYVGHMSRLPGRLPVLVEPVSESERHMIEVAAGQLDGIPRSQCLEVPYIPHGTLEGDEETDD